MNAAEIIGNRAVKSIEQAKLAFMDKPSPKEQERLAIVRKRMREVRSICREDEEFKDGIWKQYPEWCMWLSEQEKSKEVQR